MGIPYWQPAVQLIIVGSLKIFDIPTHKVLEKHWRNFTSLKLSEFSQIPHPSPRVTSTFNSRKANHHSITPHTHPHPHTHTHTHTQTHTHRRTKLCHLACKKTEGKLLNPWNNTSKSWTHLSSSFLLLTPEIKR